MVIEQAKANETGARQMAEEKTSTGPKVTNLPQARKTKQVGLHL